MNPGPIMIGGLDRSGKTLMRSLLVGHPNIAIPEVGSNMWTYFYRRHGDLARPENFERCLEGMLRYKHVRLLSPDVDRIRREFRRGEATYGRLFGLFHQHYAEAQGKPRWGDQTGLIERYADPLFAAYPQARMIHMIRDPRDRYEASLTLWPSGKGRAGGATARWLYSVGLANRNLQRYPDRYMVVQYENLAREPAATLRHVCAFLGEEYTPAMLEMRDAPRYREKAMRLAGAPPEGSPVSSRFVGRFLSAIPPREIAFIQAYAGPTMAACGYKLEPLRLSLRSRLLFCFIDWPSNLARMIAWHVVEAVHQSLPGLLGRRLPPQMVVEIEAN